MPLVAPVTTREERRRKSRRGSLTLCRRPTSAPLTITQTYPIFVLILHLSGSLTPAPLTCSFWDSVSVLLWSTQPSPLLLPGALHFHPCLCSDWGPDWVSSPVISPDPAAPTPTQLAKSPHPSPAQAPCARSQGAPRRAWGSRCTYTV